MPQEPSVRQIEIGERQPYLKVVSHTRGSVQERLSYLCDRGFLGAHDAARLLARPLAEL
jgi:hypothetical protein